MPEYVSIPGKEWKKVPVFNPASIVVPKVVEVPVVPVVAPPKPAVTSVKKPATRRRRKKNA